MFLKMFTLPQIRVFYIIMVKCEMPKKNSHALFFGGRGVFHLNPIFINNIIIYYKIY